MKKILVIGLVVLSMYSISCKKESTTDDTTGLSQDIKNFVPQAVIDSMRKWGMTINEGKKPPTIAGIYNLTPQYCSFDNSGYNTSGQKFADYRFRFKNQNNSKLTIDMDYKNVSSISGSNATGTGSFMSGYGDNFTVFVDVNGTGSGISFKQIGFYSGKITSDGIVDFQWAFFMKEKGDDPGNQVVKVGTSRIFYDSDKLSNVTDVYRHIQNTTQALSAEQTH